jgi:polyisoprenoid-binding protein YceI
MHDHLLPKGEWNLDPARSRIGFAVRKLGFGTVRGCFSNASASIVAEDGVTAGGAVSVATIDTGSEDRDAHLRGDGFFDAGAHPEIVFAATRTEPCGDAWAITGTLVMHGVPREVTLTASVDAAPDPGRRRLYVRGEIDRREFGLRWSRAIETSGVVAATVRLELDLEFERVRKNAHTARLAAAAA